jgi:PP-loop superfamily ATP-utilizing enzyme
MTQRFISYGGGVQSSALIVLAATGQIAPVHGALFANTGDDSEHPATLRFVREVMTPWAAKHGITVHELQRVTKGNKQTLWGRVMDYTGEKTSEPLPVYGYTGAPLSRTCTVDHKIKVLERWIKRNAQALPVETLIGISSDEIERAKPGNDTYEIRRYPLLDLGLSRIDCVAVIKEAGLPVPPKSACFFCPFHSMLTWSELRRDSPDLFARAVALEDKMNERRARLNKPPVYLTRKLVPLSQAVSEASNTLFEEQEMAGQCDSGRCFV